YHPYRRASQRGERRHPELSVRALHPAGIPGAVSLAAPLGHVLGQSQCSAHGAVGLLPPDPLRPSRDDQGRPAILRRPLFARNRNPPFLALVEAVLIGILLMLFYRRSAALWPVVLGHYL